MGGGVIRKDGLVEKYPRIKEITEKWSVNCPPAFEVDINRGVDIKRGKELTYVTCERKDYDTCKEGYIKSWYVEPGYSGSNIDGIFGCVKLNECVSENGDYYYGGIGRQNDLPLAAYCQNCYAGGCADYEMSEQMQVGWLCKVNYKEPASTPACSAYDAKDWQR